MTQDRAFGCVCASLSLAGQPTPIRPVAEARAAIETTALKSLQNLPSVTTDPTAVRRLTVRWQSASVTSQLTAIPGVTRRDDRTVTVEGDMLHLYRLFYLFVRVATAVTSNPPYC